MTLTPDREAELLDDVRSTRAAVERAEKTVARRRQAFEAAVLDAHAAGISERTIAVVAGVGRRAIYDIRNKHKKEPYA